MLMDLMHDIFGRLNIIDRVLGVISAIRYSHVTDAARNGLTAGVAEFTGAATLQSTHQFAIPRKGDHSLNEVERLLKRYGVRVFGRTHDSRHMYFRVMKRQAEWAEYLLLHAGIDVQSATVSEQNLQSSSSHAPGWMPTPWSDGKRRSVTAIAQQPSRPMTGEARKMKPLHETAYSEHRTAAQPSPTSVGRATRNQAAGHLSPDGVLDRIDSWFNWLEGKR